MLVLNLQPAAALDYPNTDTGEWLANCAACCVPEISNAFARSRVPFNVVTGLLRPLGTRADRYYDRAWAEIADWVAAAGVKRTLSKARIGFLGHTYPGMLDMYSDFTMHHGQLGVHVEVLEMDDLHERVGQAGEEEVDAKIAEIRQVFDVAQPGRDKISQPVTEEASEQQVCEDVGRPEHAVVSGARHGNRQAPQQVRARSHRPAVFPNSERTAGGMVGRNDEQPPVRRN